MSGLPLLFRFIRRTGPSMARRRAVLALFALIALQTTAMGGTALRLYYDNIGGGMDKLVKAPAYPNNPSRQEPITVGFEKLQPMGVNYGTLTRGFLEAPLTGEYIFWLASDDMSALWLSTNQTPAGLRKVVENSQYTRVRQYEVRPEQRSSPVHLKGGDKYYFELLHKQGTGADHLSLAWQMPDGSVEKPISASHLMPLAVDKNWQAVAKKAPVILQEYWGAPVAVLSNITAAPGGAATFMVTVEAAPPASFQWFRNGEPVPGANLSIFTINPVTMDNDVDIISVVASNKFGSATSRNVALSVMNDTTPPLPTSALRLAEGGIIALFFSKPVDPVSATRTANYTLSTRAPIRNAQMGASPNLVLLATSPDEAGSKCTLKVANVQDRASAANRIDQPVSFPIEDGLRLWLKFDDAADSTTAKDFSGKGNDATLAGGAAIVPDGRIGGCLQLDGKSAHAVLPSGFKQFARGMSVCFWTRCSGTKRWARFLDLGNGPKTDAIVVAREGVSEHLRFQIQDKDTKGNYILAQDCLAPDAWMHFAATVDTDGTALLYQDGRLIAEGWLPLPGTFERTANYIGRSNHEIDEYFAGKLDDFRVYERALSQAEISLLVAAGYK